MFWRKKNFLQSYQTRILAKIVQKKPKNFKNHQKTSKKTQRVNKGYFLSFSLFFMLTIVPKGKMGPWKGGKQRQFSFKHPLFNVNDRARKSKKVKKGKLWARTSTFCRLPFAKKEKFFFQCFRVEAEGRSPVAEVRKHKKKLLFFRKREPQGRAQRAQTFYFCDAISHAPY